MCAGLWKRFTKIYHPDKEKETPDEYHILQNFYERRVGCLTNGRLWIK